MYNFRYLVFVKNKFVHQFFVGYKSTIDLNDVVGQKKFRGKPQRFLRRQVDSCFQDFESNLWLDREFRSLKGDLAIDELVVHELQADLKNFAIQLELNSVLGLRFFFLRLLVAILAELGFLHATVERVLEVL